MCCCTVQAILDISLVDFTYRPYKGHRSANSCHGQKQGALSNQ